MKTIVSKVELPAHWASALINADRSGLSDEDEIELDAWLKKNSRIYGHATMCEEESFFGRFGGLGCDMLEYTFLKNHEPVLKVNVKDIGYGCLGNGYTVWDRTKQENRDYMTIAHIRPDRTVKFYKNLSKKVREYIMSIANTDTGGVSHTQQDQKVLHPIK